MEPVSNNGQENTAKTPPVSNGQLAVVNPPTPVVPTTPSPVPSPTPAKANASTGVPHPPVAPVKSPPAPTLAPPASPPKPVPIKKYIRTFARDMEVLKQGGTPELTPFEPPAPGALASQPATVTPPVKEKPMGPPPPSPAFRPAQLPDVPRKKPEHLNILVHQVERPAPVEFPSTTGSLPESAPPPLPPVSLPPTPITQPAFKPPTPPPPPAPKPAPKPVPLQTYASDFSDRLKQTRASSATVIAAQEDARRGQVRPSAPPKKSNVAFVALGMILLVLGGAGAYYAYTSYLVKVAPIPGMPVVTSPIFVNETKVVAGTGTTLMRAIAESMNAPLSANSVRQLSLATTSTNVFLALDLSAPDILLRNIGIAPAVAGIVRAGDTQELFFILPVLSYRDTFAGMLSWEPTMLRDFGGLYPTGVDTASTSATSTRVTIAGFADEVVENHDVRVYRTTSNQSLIVYGYWDQRTLVIAETIEGITEILRRLANSRTIQ